MCKYQFISIISALFFFDDFTGFAPACSLVKDILLLLWLKPFMNR